MPLANVIPSSVPSSSSRRTGNHDREYQHGVTTYFKSVEILLHVINAAVICPALLICALVAMYYTDSVRDCVDDHSGRLVITGTVKVKYSYRYEIEHTTVTKEYGQFDTSGFMMAAGWTMIVSLACIIFHSVIAIVLDNCEQSDSEKYNVPYSVLTVAFSCVFGLSSLAGGIANLVYYGENNKLWSDACSHHEFSSTPQVCEDLLVVRNTEYACGVISFGITQVYLLMVVIVIWSGILINKKRCQNSTDEAAQTTSLTNESPPACIETEALSEESASEPPDMSHCDLPVPPPYEANETDEPPSYQSVLVNN